MTDARAMESALAPEKSAHPAEEQMMARAAWYYYFGGQTQQEIAERLGLTRLRVNRMLAQARAEGLVHIEIRMPLSHCVRLEEKLRRRFGLSEVAVVPTVPDLDALQRMIGEAASAMLGPLLRDGIGIGIGWGRTLSAAVKCLGPRRLPSSWVVSLMGGLTRGSGTNTFEVATEMARAIGAECYYVAAPIYCPSADNRSVLLTHYGLADVMRRAREGDVALVSAGDLSDRSLLATTHIVGESLPQLRAAGAVGDLLGTYLDEYGRPVDHPLNQRVIALSLPELKTYPASILASGGMPKLAVVRAILNAGYVNSLVTDEAVAEAMLQ